VPDLIRQSLRQSRVFGNSAWTRGSSPAEGFLHTAEGVIRFGPQAGQARG